MTMSRRSLEADEPMTSAQDAEHAVSLLRGIVDAVRDPLVLLDQDLRVLFASRSFYATFKVDRESTDKHKFYSLGDGQWNVPELRRYLDDVISHQGTIDPYEIEQDYPTIGRRTMLFDARRTFGRTNPPPTVLVRIEDVTTLRAEQRVSAKLLENRDTSIREMSPRIGNSLQIVASILLMQVRSIEPPETRRLLEDIHRRVLSVAAVQRYLAASPGSDRTDVTSYLRDLCDALGTSMIVESRPIALSVAASDVHMCSDSVVSLGLIVTELVINALKHAFDDRPCGHIVVAIVSTDDEWILSVADDGHGISGHGAKGSRSGLGSALVKALAQQLDAEVETNSGPEGTTVVVRHVASAMADRIGDSRPRSKIPTRDQQTARTMIVDT